MSDQPKSGGTPSKMTMGGGDAGFVTTRVEDMLAWARKYSLFQYPFVTACCGMEFMSLNGPRYDGLARFGAEAPRFSPRQADLLWVVGTVVQRQAPALRRIYEQMMEPKYVLAFGTCASCGGFYDNYATVAGIDKIIPVDVFVPGCPPRPEAVIDGLMLLMEQIGNGTRGPTIVPPREVPSMVQLRKKGSAVDHAKGHVADQQRALGAGSPSLGDMLGVTPRKVETVAISSGEKKSDDADRSSRASRREDHHS